MRRTAIPAYPLLVPDPRDAAIQDTERLIAAVHELVVALRANDEVYRKGLSALSNGTAIREILELTNAARARKVLADALANFEESRHQSRRSMITAGLEEGMNLTELSEGWGFSRQLTGRYAKEANVIPRGLPSRDP
jgi:hypothetical protein